MLKRFLHFSDLVSPVDTLHKKVKDILHFAVCFVLFRELALILVLNKHTVWANGTFITNLNII